ncbi:MAG: hypothetical protein B6I28_00355 [Fusobacteriia bacterium 4572_132]|nr:MAG: hypothetical protein B6I28_00355 [Fusobacteriia bacterium 4572_132]
MFGLKVKFRELKEDAEAIKNNINKLMLNLEEETKLKQDEMNNLREELKQVKKELLEENIENEILKENIKILTQENKKIIEKLFQKEQDEFKIKMLTNKTDVFPLSSDLDIEITVNNIDSLEDKIKKNPEKFKTYYLNGEKNNGVVATGSCNQEIELDSCLTTFEEPIVTNNKDQKVKKEQKKYTDLLKESKLDRNDIQKFVLDRSKSLENPEELSTNDWKKVLNFGVAYKVLTNREIQQLKQISLMLGNSDYKNERKEILNKVKENGFEISLYKGEDWEKVLEFLVENNGITEEVREVFISIFKKYKKKKIFKLKQLKFILPYFEKYKENIKNKETKNTSNKPLKEDESCLIPFGKVFNEIYVEKEEQNEMLDKVTENIIESTEEKIEQNIILVEPSIEDIEKLNAEILAVDSNEWYKAKHWLNENNILKCNHQKKVGYYNFCDVLNESKRFNSKMTIGQMNKVRDLYKILKDAGYNFINDAETKKVEQVEELKESEYDLSENQNKTFKDLELFSSKDWDNLLAWSDNKLLIESEGLKVLESLIEGKKLEEFKELELISLIELYDYLVEEGFDKDSLNLEEKGIENIKY